MEKYIELMNELPDLYKTIDELLNKYSKDAVKEHEKKMVEELKNYKEKIEDIFGEFHNMYAIAKMATSRFDEYFTQKREKMYAKEPGAIRIIIGGEYTKKGETLDVHIRNLEDYRVKIQDKVKMFFETPLREQLQNYFNEKKGGTYWEDYLKTHPDELLKTLKYENKQVIELDEEAEEEEYKKRLKEKKIAETPDIIAKKIQDAFYDNKGLLKKEYPESGEKSFRDLSTKIQSYAYILLNLWKWIPSKNKGKILEVYKQIQEKNDELLAQYPKLRELMEK